MDSKKKKKIEQRLFLSRWAQGAARGMQDGHHGGLILEPQPGCFRDGGHPRADLSGFSIPPPLSTRSHAYCKGYWMNENDLVNGWVKGGRMSGWMDRCSRMVGSLQKAPPHPNTCLISTHHRTRQPLPPPYTSKTCGSPCQISPCGFSAQPPSTITHCSTIW